MFLLLGNMSMTRSQSLSWPSSCRLQLHGLSMPYLYAIALVILACCTAVDATDGQDDVNWIYPKGGEMFYFLDTVNVTYRSPYSNPWMFIFCYLDRTVNSVTEIRMQEALPYDGSMLIPLNFTTSTSCWLNLRASDTGNLGSNSNQWTLSDVDRPGGPITTGAASVTSTSTSTSAAVTTEATATVLSASISASTSEASSNDRGGSSDGFTQGEKIGLGVGIGLGASALCIGVIWWYHRHLMQRQHEREVYRKVLGLNDDGAGLPGPVGFPEIPHDRVNGWRYQTQPLSMVSITGPSYSRISGHSTDWRPSDVGTLYQYYDPSYTEHPGQSSVAGTSTPVPPSIAGQTAVRRSFNHSHADIAPTSMPDPVAIRTTTDTRYDPRYDPEGQHATTSCITPQRRMPSVNYGPGGRLDAGTGADFSLLPDYQSPNSNGRPRRSFANDDLYDPSTPPTPPPPHSAHTRTHQQPRHLIQPNIARSSTAAPSVAPSDAPSELPAEQVHRGYGPAAELPGDGQQPMLRHQRSNLYAMEQKFLLSDVAPLRTEGGRSSRT
ncbi:hypothetical protein VM1G_04678 [Cytospora mali]|uniref:Uncharacterized protein n=1 Tax=Cytospora mali TaxID=578113 RepID=A0A194VYT6_CYTMA|nr:hypothetical protein VM1G_04678 [Valsa mali]